MGIWLELTKPRLSMMSVISALFGYLAAPSPKHFGVLSALLAGTAFAAAGAAVLNQWMEREEDALMRRTAGRPLPAGKLNPQEALAFGLTLSVLGVLVHGLWVNALSAGLIALTLGLYVLVYTPLKKRTPLNTLVGAVPGALPPLVGYTAAENGLGLMGWILFGVLFAWQMPHFMAISWIHREDYSRGGFRMLSHFDPSGSRVAAQSLRYTLLLIAITLVPLFYFEVSVAYWLPAALLNVVMLWLAVRFCRTESKLPAARQLFFATLFYLPIYLAALVAGLRFNL